MTLTTAERQTRRRVLLEPDQDGNLVGRDPRDLTPADWAEAGIEPTPVLSAVRAKCLDCSSGSIAEVRLCTVVGCALWPFRMNKNPFRTPPTEEQRRAAGDRLMAARQARETVDSE